MPWPADLCQEIKKQTKIKQNESTKIIPFRIILFGDFTNTGPGVSKCKCWDSSALGAGRLSNSKLLLSA
jgi:hypothetical protein